jgi:hypothetical protein
LHGIFEKRRQAAYSRYRVSIPGRVEAEHRGESAKVNGAGVKALKKLNVFALIGSKRQIKSPGLGQAFLSLAKNRLSP